MKRPAHFLAPLAIAIALASAAPAAAQDNPTDESAIWQLKTATFVHRDSMHNVLLRSLRQLRDPKLEPLFSELVQQKHPDLKIHGILGLAEIDPKRRINLALLAALDAKEYAKTQAQIASLALESGLMDSEQCKQVLGWGEADLPVKVICAAALVAKGELTDDTVLKAAMAQTKNPGLRGMGALLSLVRGNEGAMAVLDELLESDDALRDEVLGLVLQTSLQYKLRSVGPWAMKVLATRTRTDPLAFVSLRVAVEFNQPGAVDRFIHLYRTAESVADRIRFSVLALEMAEHLDAGVFDLMINDEVGIIQYMGRTGKAIAEDKDPTELMLKLLEQNHVLASRWVMSRASKTPFEQARAIYVGAILAAEAEPNPPLLRNQRIEHAVIATEALANNKELGAPLIPGLFDQVPELTSEAMLMGLIRTNEAGAGALVEGRTDWPSDTARSLALLLRAKNGAKLNEREMERLELIVRGGGRLEAPLRIQAAWVYGKITGRDKVYLASVLGD